MEQNWPFIGITEGWIENGLTKKQMMNRIKELGLLPDKFSQTTGSIMGCSLQPYYLNFLQRPDLNKILLNQIIESQDSNNNGAYWIATSNLWTPGQTINIVFNSTAPTDMQYYVKTCILKYLQPHVSMKLNFTGGTTGDILVNLAYMSAGGGTSSVGKQGRQQTVNLNTDRFKNKMDISKLGDTINTYSSGKFILQRYLVLHEFGHAMGLYHEWQRENCGNRGINCSSTHDYYSVMNYFNQGTMGVKNVVPSKDTMDGYSPIDIEWLEKVYKSGTGNNKTEVSSSFRSLYVPYDKIDLQQMGLSQISPEHLTDERVRLLLSSTDPNNIRYNDITSPAYGQPKENTSVVQSTLVPLKFHNDTLESNYTIIYTVFCIIITLILLVIIHQLMT